MIIEIQAEGTINEINNNKFKVKDDGAYLLISTEDDIIYKLVGHNTSVAQRFKTSKLLKQINEQINYKTVDLLNSDKLSIKKALKQVKIAEADKLIPDILKKLRKDTQIQKKTKAVLKKSEEEADFLQETTLLQKIRDIANNSDKTLDYVISNFQIYRADYVDQDITFVAIEGAGDGVFDAPNYFPKVLFSKNKVSAITLWRVLD